MGKSPMTTLCYIEKDDSYLMLHRVSKKKRRKQRQMDRCRRTFLKKGESPDECLMREVYEGNRTYPYFPSFPGDRHFQPGRIRNRVHVPVYGRRI